MLRRSLLCPLLASSLGIASAQATTVPNEIQLPGTQPTEVTLESVQNCDNCHAGYDLDVEPDFNWDGSMMAHASRDPLFWAAVAVAEQDFSGSGDLCIRCHTPQGWIADRSTPTDGSDLNEDDAESVSCDVCHQLTNPDDSEHLGVQNPPFLANDEGMPPTAYTGNGMLVLYGGSEKLGPYNDPASPHSSLQSEFHRSAALCGSCHDVSNPLTGDLAHNNGAFTPLPMGTFSDTLGSAVETKAAFNNPPAAYGVLERTYSEHVTSELATTRISQYGSLPADLQAGAIKIARDMAVASNPPSGDYVDGTPRSFSCQSCHMPPVQGAGCRLAGSPVRNDLPLHDLTGAGYWMPDAIQYLDSQDKLVLGEDLLPGQNDSLDAGQLRAIAHLKSAASLKVTGNTVRVVNLTGHKLITGYPEGRRMWLRVRWFDQARNLLRTDGEYGSLAVTIDGMPEQVDTILDLADPNTKIYETHLGLTQEWAAELLMLGLPMTLPLTYDRVTGAVDVTLGDLAAMSAGATQESFHFVLNNTVLKDNRIPAYGMSYDDAVARNTQPYPASQYGNPTGSQDYDYWDDFALNPPSGAFSAKIDLLYQTTSWEYIQFLHLANDGSITHLASTGDDMLEAWQMTGMSAPVVMASAIWNAKSPNRGVWPRGGVDGSASRAQ